MNNINSNYSELKADTLSNPFRKNQGSKINEIMRNKGGLTKYIIALVFLISLIICISMLISKNSQLKSIAKEKEAYERQIKEIQVSNEQITHNIQEIEASVKKLTREKNDLLNEEADLKKRKEELANENKVDYDKEIQMLTDQLEAATKRYDQMKKDNPNIDKDKGELEAMVVKYKEELASLQQEYERLRKELGQPDNGNGNQGNNNNNQGNNQRDVRETRSGLLTQEMYNTLLQFFKGRIRLELVYQASPKNFYPEAFHDHVARRTNTITIVKFVEGPVVGGYTSVDWLGTGYKTDPYAFVFNLDTGIKYSVNDPERAIFCDPAAFPIFGKKDLDINVRTSSDFPSSYGNPSNTPLELTQKIPIADLTDFEVFELITLD